MRQTRLGSKGGNADGCEGSFAGNTGARRDFRPENDYAAESVFRHRMLAFRHTFVTIQLPMCRRGVLIASNRPPQLGGWLGLIQDVCNFPHDSSTRAELVSPPPPHHFSWRA